MPTAPRNVPSLTHANRHLGGEDDLGLAAVALSGSYNDLTSKPSIPAGGLPVGGTTNQILKKNSSTNYDTGWEDLPSGIPTGGTINQALVKNSGTDDDVKWASVLGLPVGLTGATTAARFVGGTTGGAPVTGTFAVNDFVIDPNAIIWVCTSAGSPGTWTKVHNHVETVNVIGNSGSTQTLPDVNVATMHTVTLNAACTFTMPTAGAGKSFCLEATQDGTGGRVPVFTGVRWTGGSMVAASTAPSAVDIYAFACLDGSHWDGVMVAKGLA